MKIKIPEEKILVIYKGEGKRYYFFDTREPLNEITVIWRWDGKKFSDGHHLEDWLKDESFLKPLKGTLLEFNIPFPRELEINGVWEEHYLNNKERLIDTASKRPIINASRSLDLKKNSCLTSEHPHSYRPNLEADIDDFEIDEQGKIKDHGSDDEFDESIDISDADLWGLDY